MPLETQEQVVFWTEGGHHIGMGHLSRCLVIHSVLSERGHAARFIVNDDPAVAGRLTSEGFPFCLGDLSVASVPDWLTNQRKIIVFDTKKDVGDLERRLKGFGHRVVLMDNYTPARLEADVAIYPSAMFDDSMNWSGFRGQVHGGVGYAPVGGDYLRIVAESRNLRHRPPYQLLVTMGGSDPFGVTYSVVDALTAISAPLDITVALGPSFSTDRRLDRLEMENRPGLEFERGRNSLAPLMAKAHMAITAVGTTLYELATVGVPAVIIANYPTDRADMERYGALGMNLPLGFYRDVSAEDIRDAAMQLINDAAAWQAMRRTGWELVDGQGAHRIVDLLLEPD